MSREMREDFAQVLLFAPMENKKQITDAVDSLVRIATAAAEAKFGKLIHYPDCWDTAAYPTLESALREIGCNSADCIAAPLVGGVK